MAMTLFCCCRASLKEEKQQTAVSFSLSFSHWFMPFTWILPDKLCRVPRRSEPVPSPNGRLHRAYLPAGERCWDMSRNDDGSVVHAASGRWTSPAGTGSHEARWTGSEGTGGSELGTPGAKLAVAARYDTTLWPTKERTKLQNLLIW